MNRSAAVRVTAGGLVLGTFAPRDARAQTAILRIGAGTSDSFGEGRYVHDGGFLKRQGLDAEISAVPNGGASVAALLGGSLDATVSNVATIAAAYIRGLPLAVIAGSAVYKAADPPTTVLMVLKDSPIASARDLTGKAVGLSTLHDLQQAALMTWIDKTGGSSADVNYTEITNALQLNALKQRRVDAIVAVEPWTTAGLADGRIVTKPYDALGNRLTTTAWIVRREWAEKNPDTVRKLVTAIYQTASWANRNKAATAAILEKYSDLSRETVSTMNRLSFAERLDPAEMQPIIDASARYGFLPKTFPAGDLYLRG